MDQINPYEAPKARVEPVGADHQIETAQSERLPCFPVGLAKFATMSLLTFGLYDFYWFYRQWRAARELSGDKLNPVLRALFSPFTAYFLFCRIRDTAGNRRFVATFSPAGLAFAYFVLLALSRLPDSYWLVSLLAFAPLLQIQSTANELNEVAVPGSGRRNHKLTAWNGVGLAIGCAFLLLVLVGLFYGRGAA